MGSDKPFIRLGGIYALEGVMNTSAQYHQPVLEALSAFVRDGTRTDMSVGPPTTDIQAALTVIARRKVIPPESQVFLGWCNIPRSFLVYANLRSANLLGANLTEAQLDGVDLSYASLIGTNLTQATMGGANLSHAFLSDAHLNSAYLKHVELTGAYLKDVDLTGAEGLTQTQLDQACGTNVKLDPGLTIKPCLSWVPSLPDADHDR